MNSTRNPIRTRENLTSNLTSALEPNLLSRIRQVAGFDEIELIGPSSIRSPLTGRIVQLRTASQRRNFLERAQSQVQRGRLFQQSINGYDFRQTGDNATFGTTTHEYNTPYNLPVDRVSLKLERMLNDFQAHANTPAGVMLCLSTRLEDGRYVSEKPKLVSEL